LTSDAQERPIRVGDQEASISTSTFAIGMPRADRRRPRASAHRFRPLGLGGSAVIRAARAVFDQTDPAAPSIQDTLEMGRDPCVEGGPESSARRTVRAVVARRGARRVRRDRVAERYSSALARSSRGTMRAAIRCSSNVRAQRGQELAARTDCEMSRTSRCGALDRASSRTRRDEDPPADACAARPEAAHQPRPSSRRIITSLTTMSGSFSPHFERSEPSLAVVSS